MRDRTPETPLAPATVTFLGMDVTALERAPYAPNPVAAEVLQQVDAEAVIHSAESVVTDSIVEADVLAGARILTLFPDLIKDAEGKQFVESALRDLVAVDPHQPYDETAALPVAMPAKQETTEVYDLELATPISPAQEQKLRQTYRQWRTSPFLPLGDSISGTLDV